MPVVLVTGCSRGIGHAAALALAARGWTVIGTVRGPPGVAAELEPAPGEAALRAGGVEVERLDVTDPVATQALVRRVLDRHGGLDAVVANAGRGLSGCFEDLDPGQIAGVLELNLLGAMHTVRACLPAIRARRGRVVLISSVAGGRAAPGSGAYNASKFALEGWGEALRFELLPFGVQVVLVQPGATATGFAQARERGARVGQGPYREISARLDALLAENVAGQEPVEGVVRAVLKAVVDPSPPFRIPTGRGTRAQLLARRLLPWSLYEALVRRKLALPRSPA